MAENQAGLAGDVGMMNLGYDIDADVLYISLREVNIEDCGNVHLTKY